MTVGAAAAWSRWTGLGAAAAWSRWTGLGAAAALVIAAWALLPGSVTGSDENPYPEVNPCASGASEVSGTIKVCTLIREEGVVRVFTEPRRAMVWIQISETGPTAHVTDTSGGVAHVGENLTQRDDWHVSIQTWNLPPGVRLESRLVYLGVTVGEARTFTFACDAPPCSTPAPTSTTTPSSGPPPTRTATSTATADATPPATPTSTITATIAASVTPHPTATITATEAATATASASPPPPSPTSVATATDAATHGATADPTGTATSAPTSLPSETAMPTPTSFPSEAATTAPTSGPAPALRLHLPLVSRHRR